jgi:phosphatidyl-myo-inositol dimannoside synthase
MHTGNPMKILLITWNYPPKTGGMENMLFEVVRQLTSTAQVDIIAPFADFSKDELEIPRLVRAGREGLLAFFAHALWAGIRLTREKKYDVIMTGSALVLPIAVFLGFTFRLPVVAIIHGLDIIYPNPLYQIAMRFLLPRCRHIIANSRMTKQLAIEHGLAPDRVTVINPGIDVSEFDRLRDPHDIRQRYDIGNRRFILSAGRLVKRKGVLEFISRALPDIIQHDPDAVLVVVGENPSQSLAHRDDLMTQIRNEIVRQGLQKNVRLVGWTNREDLIAFYQSSDIFVLPAIHVPGDIEGFGIVLLEANAARKPVVATSVGGIPDAVAEGVSGILIEPEKWATIAQSVTTLLHDDELRQKLGRQGRDRVENEFDWKIIGRQYRNLLTRILSPEQEIRRDGTKRVADSPLLRSCRKDRL